MGRVDAMRDSFRVYTTDNTQQEIGVIVNQIKKEIDIMPSIRQRKTGLYEARLSFKGKYFSVYDRSLQKLKTKITKKFKELEKAYKNEKTLAKTKKDWISLNQWYKEWIENDKKPFVSNRTVELIEGCFRVHILPKLGKIKLNDLDKTKIQAFLNGMPKSRTKEITSNYFKACISQAYKERLIEYNPFDTVKLDKKIVSDKVGFTAEEQKRILEHLKQNDLRLYKIILLYLCTGCRRAELKTIELENIKEDYLLIQGTKTKNATRYLNISQDLKNLIIENIDLIHNFPEDYISKRFKKALTELGIKGTLHSLRHTFATNHYFLGTKAKLLQEWMGHSTINITLDIYTNINPTIKAENEKRLIQEIYNNLYYYSD